MRATWRLALVVAVAGGIATPALAQPGGGGWLLQSYLLTSPGVQKELKLTDEQVTRVRVAEAQARDDLRDDFARLRDPNLSREDRAKLMRKIFDVDTKAMAGILNADQSKRFKQITLQTQGFQAFHDPEVQKALKLTGEQKEKLQKIAQESAQKVRELLPKLREQAQAGGVRQEVMKKLADLRKESVTQAVGLLTDEQKKTWKEMTGAPFEFRFDHGLIGAN